MSRRMSRWDEAQLNEYLHRGKDADHQAPVSDAKPEQSARPEPLGTDQGEGPRKGRTIVRIISLRTSLLDEDNLAGGSKYLTDALRYAGLLKSDDPLSTSLGWRQEKVPHKDQEETIIQITYP